MAIDTIFYLIAFILISIGLVGCVLPMLPGPPIAFFGLIFIQLTNKAPFSIAFLVTMGVLAVVVTILDYIIPGLGTKKFGGSKIGTWGCFVGTIAGLFVFPPFGLLVMPFVGALLGEFINGTPTDKALRAAFGALIGFLSGTVCKILLCVLYLGAAIYTLFI